MRILFAEDDRHTAELVHARLTEAGHDVTWVLDGAQAQTRGEIDQFDVVILDRMLPMRDGVAVLRAWRDRGLAVPVLLLTALGGIGERVEGLDAGADDYLVKPFAFPELVARVTALGRRGPGSGASPNFLKVGDVTLDLLRREARRSGRELRLQPREFALLEQLMRNAGRVVTRTMFLEAVWGYGFDPQTNIVESHLSRMRAKLNEGFDGDLIETLRGVGYRLRADG